ncbi:hypothetical protein JL720_1531 [Aureococcus anophagefferens]|nr:hypothetical protein JL720_1531 [Aureococcus anophagefferens]
MDDALVTRLFEETTKALTEAPSVDIRELELPLARIKRIMKLEDEVQSQLDGRKNMMVSSEAPVVFAKACELFIREITTRAWTCTRAMWQQQIAAHMFYAQQGAGAAAPEGDDSRKRKAPDDAASD